MAESDISISEMTNGTFSAGAIFPAIQPSQQSASGYSNVKLSGADIGDGIGQLQFPLRLNTENKSIFGAINEAAAGGVVLTGTLNTGSTTITLSDAAIDGNSTFDFYTSIYGVNPTAVTVTTGAITLTFEQQAADMGVKVVVK